jgi:hypothetical protein
LPGGCIPVQKSGASFLIPFIVFIGVNNCFGNNGNSSGIPVQSTIIQRNRFQLEVDFNLTSYQNGIYYLYIFDGTTTYVRLIRKD